MLFTDRCGWCLLYAPSAGDTPATPPITGLDHRTWPARSVPRTIHESRPLQYNTFLIPQKKYKKSKNHGLGTTGWGTGKTRKRARGQASIGVPFCRGQTSATPRSAG
jgi:hypothetical protein